MRLVVERQDRQRAEIQAKLTAMLAGLKAPASDAAAGRLPLAPASGAAAAPGPWPHPESNAREEARTATPPGVRTPAAPAPTIALEEHAAQLNAKLDVMFSRARTPAAGRGSKHPDLLPTHAPSPHSPELQHSAGSARGRGAESDQVLALHGLVRAMGERMDRLEAACIMAATTLDSVVSSLDDGLKSAFDAARSCAREEARSVVANETHPALRDVSEASASAQGEIHSVMRLLATCVERIVDQLHRLETAAGHAASPSPAGLRLQVQPPAQAHAAIVPEPPPAPEPILAAPAAPAVPLGGLGRRSRLAALIDFGFGTRAA